MLLPAMAMGQYITLWHNDKGSSLQFDVDRLWSYNLYEHSRWGGGLKYDIALKGKTFDILSLDGYVAYGCEDRRFKWGAKADFQGYAPGKSHSYIEFFHDLTNDGSRSLNKYSIRDFTASGSFMTRLFSDTYRLTIGNCTRAKHNHVFGVELRLSHERYMWGGINLAEWNDFLSQNYLEGHLYFSNTSGWKGDLAAGYTTGIEADSMLFVRVLTQFDHLYSFSVFNIHLFLQGGLTSLAVPYSRMFDLGGTFGAPLYFRNSLLTARPNEFTANTFAFLSLRFGPSNPLCRLWSPLLQMGTYPVPFVALHAAWGHLWGQRDDGRLWDSLELQAPHLGIGEAIAGVDGLFRWGLVDWGVAVAYRLTPPQAPYHFTQTQDNLALLVTAALIF